MADRRPHILVLNQYYKPGVEATANLLADLCESLAEEFDVTVVTGRLQGRAELPSRELLNGVRVLRTRSTAFDRTKLRFRAMNYITYLVDSFVRAHSVASPDLVLCMTDPPIVGDLGLLIARSAGHSAARDQRGRLPRDRDGARATDEPAGRRAAPRSRRLLPSSGGHGRGDRRADARAADREGGAAGARDRDPELGRHRVDHAAAEAERVVARSRARRPLRGHALGERRTRPEPRQADRRDDAPSRSRRARRCRSSASAPAAASWSS